MKREFTLDVNGQQVTVTAERDGDTIRVTREDTEYRVRILADSVPGVQAATDRPTGSAAPRAEAPVARRPVSPAGGATGSGATNASKPTSSAGAGGHVVASPMTGVIDQLSVAEGAVVAEGDTIIVLEAMKMYIDVVAPAAGTITSVAVKAGDSVREGQELLSIDAGGGAG